MYIGTYVTSFQGRWKLFSIGPASFGGGGGVGGRGPSGSSSTRNGSRVLYTLGPIRKVGGGGGGGGVLPVLGRYN